MSLASGRCHSHPDRPGIGVCVECRQVICVECSTQFEGINRCATCLGARLASVRAPVQRREYAPANILWALIALTLLFGGIYGLAGLLAL